MKKVKEIIGRLTAGSLRLAALFVVLGLAGSAWATDYTYSNVDSDTLAVASDGSYNINSLSFTLAAPSSNHAASDFPSSGYVQLTSISVAARANNGNQTATTATLTKNGSSESYAATVTFSDTPGFTASKPDNWTRKEVKVTFATDGVLVDTTATYTLTFGATTGCSVVRKGSDDWKPAMRIYGRTPSGSMLLSRSYLSDVSFGGEVPDLVVLKDATGFSISGDTVTIPATPIQILMSRSAVTMIATVEGIPSTASVMAGVTVNNNTTYWDACSTRTTTGFQNGAANGYSSSGALSTNNNSGWGVASTETVAAGEHAFAFVYAGSGDYYGTHAYLDGSAVANKEQHNGLTWSGYTIKTLTVGGTKANVTSIPDASASGMTIKAIHIYTSALSPAQIATVTAALNKGWTVDAAGTTLTSATLRELPNDANVLVKGSLSVAADGTCKATTSTEQVQVLAGGTFDIGTTRPTIVGIASTGTLAVTPIGATVSQQIEGYEATAILTVTGDIEGTVTLSGNTVTPVIEAGTATLTTVVPSNPSYTGDAWWWDYEFNGNVTSIGSDKGGMTPEGSGTSFYNNSELYFQKTPYRGASFSDKSELTAIMYCAPGNYANSVLVGFGSTTAGEQKAIALVTGANPAAGEMKLVLTDGHSGGTGTVTELADLTAVGATTTKHLYAFVMDRITEDETTKTRVRVYLDGKVKAIYKHNGTLTLSNGFQIGSLHGGVYPRDGFNTGLTKYSASGDSGTLDFLRVVDGTLTDAAMSALAGAYPYNSVYGKATRAPVSSTANWVATDVWTQTVPGQADATRDVPNQDTNVTLSKDGSSDVSVAINLQSDSNYESLTLTKEAGATGSLKLTSGLGNGTSGKLITAETSVLVDTTVPAGRVHLGVTSIADGTTLTVDPVTTVISDAMSSLGFGEVYEDVVISMALEGNGASVVLDPAGVSTLAGYGFTAELVYNLSNLSYTFKLTREEATADIEVSIASNGTATWATRSIPVPAPASIPDTYTGTVTVNNASTDPVTIATDFAGGNIDVASGSAIFTGAITTSGTVDVEASLAVGGATAYYSSLADAVTAFGTSEGTLTLLANTASALTLVPGQTLVAGSFTTGGVSVASGNDGYELKNEDGTYTLVDNRTSTWNGAAEGTWSTAANWSTGYVPTQYTTVTFGDGADITLDANATVAGIVVNGDVSITASQKSLNTSGNVTGTGTLTLSDVCLASANAEGITVEDGVAVNFTNDSELAHTNSGYDGVTLNGAVTISGSFKAWDVLHTVYGAATIKSGAAFNGNNCCKFEGAVTVEGTVTVDGSKVNLGDDAAVVLATAGATLTDSRGQPIVTDNVSTTVAGSYVKKVGTTFSVETFKTVTFVDEDGETVLQTVGNLKLGDAVAYTGATPTKDATAQYTYTFSGWDPAITTVSGNETYRATYSSTVNEYTITWKNDDGSTIDTTVVAYGDTPTHADASKAATAQYTYTFTGWDPAIATVTGDAEYTAQFSSTVNNYKVTIPAVEHASTVVVTIGAVVVPLEDGGYTVPYGSEVTITYTADDGYFFGNDTDKTIVIASVEGDTAVPAEQAGSTTAAVAQDSDGGYYPTVYSALEWLAAPANFGTGYVQLLGETVGENIYGDYGVGYDAAAKRYAKAAATVSGTTAGYLTVQEAINVAANEGTVNLKADNAEELTLANGKTVTIKAKQAQTIYTYTPPVAAGDYTVDAGETVEGMTTYTAREWYSWTVTVVAANATVTGVEDGDTVSESDPDITFTVAAAATYKVTSVQVNGTQVGTTAGEYNATLTGDTTITVETELDVATVTFYAENGTDVIQSGDVTIGQTPVFNGTTPIKTTTAQYTYTFAGWAATQGGAALAQLPAVTASGATYYAVFTETVNNYTVTWVVDGVSTSETLAYGATPTHAAPTKEATAQYTYTFTGWTPAIATVTGDATYTAQFSETVNNYTITWVVDGVSTSETLAYGATPTHAAPTKEATAQYTYTFTGWTPEVVAVTEDATYTAQFSETVNKYTVTFTWEGGSSSAELEYGAMPTAPADPAKYVENNTIYTFAGWEPAVVSVTSAATYTAQYSETPAVAQIGSTYYADLATALNAGKGQGTTVTLLADVDLNGVAWTPVGTAADPFRGTFDGGNRTIRNLSISYNSAATSGATHAGLFGDVNGGTIRNVRMENVTITNGDNPSEQPTASYGGRYGAIVGLINGGSIDSCTVKNVTIKDMGHIGGIAGANTGNTTISDCLVYGTIQLASGSNQGGGWDVGGIIGKNQSGRITVMNCQVDGTDAADSKIYSQYAAGGIVGFTAADSISGCAVKNVTVEAGANAYDVSQGNRIGAGGIIGCLKGTVSGCELDGVTVKYTDTAEGAYAAVGLVGGAQEGSAAVTVSGITVKDSAAYWGDTRVHQLDPGRNTNTAKAAPVVTYTDAPVAVIGMNYYNSLDAALDAVKAASIAQPEITLVGNAKLAISKSKTDNVLGGEGATKITINGNGNTLTFVKSETWAQVNTANNAELVLNNVALAAENSANFAKSGYNNDLENPNHNIAFNCEVELNNVTSSTALSFFKDASLDTVAITDTNNVYAIWIHTSASTVDIDDLVITAPNGRGIKVDDTFVEAWGGTPSPTAITIDGATFTTKYKAAVLVNTSYATTVTASGDIDITGVTADSDNLVWVDESSATRFNLVTVTGADKVVEPINNGYAATLSTGNIINGYYKTLVAAVTAATTESVAMLKDVTETFTVSKTITIARGGFTAANMTAGEGYTLNTTDEAYTFVEVVEVTLPTIANATITSVTVGGESVTVTAGTVTVTPGAEMVITYTAAEGYVFAGNTTTATVNWTQGEPAPEISAPAAAVAQVGTTYYATLAEAVARVKTDASSERTTVTLLQDTAELIVIDFTYPILIDGQGHGISQTSVADTHTGIKITAPHADVVIENAVVGNENIGRAVNILGAEGVTLLIKDSALYGTMYPLNVYPNGSAGVDNEHITITNSTITGYCALNLWGTNGVVRVVDSTLSGVNDKGYTSDGDNDFGVIALEGLKNTPGANGYDIEVEGSTITAVQTTGNTEYIVLYNPNSQNNTVRLTNCVISRNGDTTYYPMIGEEENATGNSLYVKNTTDAATSAIPELPAGYAYSAPDADGYRQVVSAVAEVNGTGYATLAAAIAQVKTDASSERTTVTLLQDTAELIVIDFTYPILIDGQGHGISQTSVADTHTGIKITAPHADVVIENAVVGNENIGRAVNILGAEGVTLLIKDSALYGTMYPLNVYPNGSAGVDNEHITITNSTITGYCALNLWGTNGVVRVVDSTLSGVNDKGYTSDGDNDFGVIALEGLKNTPGANGYDIEVEGSTITAVQTTGNTEYIVLYNPNSQNNTVRLTNCVISRNGDTTYYPMIGEEENATGNSLYVKNTTDAATSAIPELPAGYAYSAPDADGYRQVVSAVAEVNGTGYATLAAAIAQVKTDASSERTTVTLLQDTAELIVIDFTYPILIDGQGHGISQTSVADTHTGIKITAPHADVVIENAVVGNENIGRAVNILGAEGVTLLIKDSALYGTMYPLNVYPNGSAGVDNEHITITNSTITGYCALNLWGTNGVVRVVDSTLSGVNDKGYTSDGDNDFGVIALEGLKNTPGANGYDIEVEGSTITAVQTTGNTEYIVLYNPNSQNNTVRLTNCVISRNGDTTYYPMIGEEENATGNSLYVKNTTDAATSAIPELPAGYAYSAPDADGYRQVVKAITFTVDVPEHTAVMVDGEPYTANTEITRTIGTTVTITYAADGAYVAGGTQSQQVTVTGATSSISAPNDYTITEAVAQVGTTYYATLQAALDAVQDGETILILSDITETAYDSRTEKDNAVLKNGATRNKFAYVEISDKSYTIDFGGHTVTTDANNAPYRSVFDIATTAGDTRTVTFTNGTITAVASTINCIRTLALDGTPGTLVLNLHDMTLNNNQGWGVAIKPCNGTTVDLAGTDIYSVDGGNIDVQDNARVVIHDGVFTQTGGVGFTGDWDTCRVNVSVSYGGVAEILGGTFTSSKYGFEVCSSGGTITVDDATATADGLVLRTTGGAGVIEVTGGKFSGAYASTAGDTISISGGVFAQQPAAAYAATGYAVVANTDSETSAAYPWTVALATDTTAVKPDNSTTITDVESVEEAAAEVTIELTEDQVAAGVTEELFTKEVTENNDGTYTVTVKLDETAVKPATATVTLEAENPTIAVANVKKGLYYTVVKEVNGAVTKGTPTRAESTENLNLAVDNITDPAAGTVNKVTVKVSVSADSANTVESSTYCAMAPVAENKLNIVAVPWRKIGGNANTIPVSEVIKTSALNEGDELYVYNENSGSYFVWALAANKTWTAVPTIVVSEFGNAEVFQGEPAEEIYVTRGGAFWVKFADANFGTSKIVLIGEEVTDAGTKQIEAGTTEEPKFQLCASPKATPFQLNAEGAFTTGDIVSTSRFSQPGDTIQLTVDSGEPIVFYYKNGKWGRTVGWQWSTSDADTTIPVGVGFWYISRGGRPTIKW